MSILKSFEKQHQILQNAENQSNEIDLSSCTSSSAESQRSGKNDDFKPFFPLKIYENLRLRRKNLYSESLLMANDLR